MRKSESCRVELRKSARGVETLHRRSVCRSLADSGGSGMSWSTSLGSNLLSNGRHLQRTSHCREKVASPVFSFFDFFPREVGYLAVHLETFVAGLEDCVA